MKLAKLEPSSRVEGRWLVWLEDGTLLRIGEADVVSFSLYAGMELDETQLDGLRMAQEQAKLKQKALSLLSARPMSQRELERKLSANPRKKGMPEEGEEQREQRRDMAQQVAQRMAQVGLVNDREYASTVVRHYSRKGYGPAKIRDELYRRGVPRELWDQAMEELKQDDRQLRALVEKKLRGAVPTREELKKVSAYLARRGFGWEEISRVLRQVEEEAE
ncbi:MAG TPA: regulatory protein RecX [Candidatus Enterenecus avicola]|nr:regulatory protein RecX [Candidatus Enterenecus avicola]